MNQKNDKLATVIDVCVSILTIVVILPIMLLALISYGIASATALIFQLMGKSFSVGASDTGVYTPPPDTINTTNKAVDD